MTMERVKELWFSDSTPATLAELAENGAAALAAGDVERAIVAKSGEARHARFLEGAGLRGNFTVGG